MDRRAGFALLALATLSSCQQVGTNTPEVHPALPVQSCTAAGCTTLQTKVVIDSNWRWTHKVGTTSNCYTGNAWDTSICPDPTTCASQCALDGANYASDYGVTTSGNALTLNFVTKTNVGSRLYLMANDNEYQMFNLLNQEFSFDVDMSTLPRGINGALYFTEMAKDGGMSKYSGNKAGAAYGTGYCDAQCPHDIKFINGEANIENWTGSSSNSGTGKYGTCCSEMDIWEANSEAAAYTAHTCNVDGQTRATDGSACDQAGCDFNSYRLGNDTFLGVGKTVDTSKVFTVVTQFITTDGTANGDLSEIRRSYVQNGVVVKNSVTNVPGMSGEHSSLSDAFCSASASAFSGFGKSNTMAANGGMAKFGKALGRGMVLALSLWDDYTANMLWLDSAYPTTAPTSGAGVVRGGCSSSSGVPATVENQNPNAHVVYSNIKFGDIGSTFSGSGGSSGGGSSSSSTSSTASSTASSPSSTMTTMTTSTTTATSTASSTVSSPAVLVCGSPSSTSSSAGSPSTPVSNAACVAEWGTCGGQAYTGAGCCSGLVCQYSNPWYSQCLKA